MADKIMQEISKSVDNSNSDAPIIIKKYANRRLYNTLSSKYIIQKDIIEFINNGTDFVIEDAKTGKDITRTILNQIIFEQETQRQEFLFPLEFQKQLIRLYNDTYSHMVPGFLTQSINYFDQERKRMTNVWEGMVNQNTEFFVKKTHEMAVQNFEIFRNTWDVFNLMKQEHGSDQSNQKVDPKLNRNDDPLELMQKQIDALKLQIESMK